MNGSANVPITKKLLKMVKDAHSKSFIPDQLISNKRKAKSFKKKEEDQKYVNNENK